jgi:hypothetical protein
MYELVRVGADQLIGEIIRLEGDNATIQVTMVVMQPSGTASASLERPGYSLRPRLMPEGQAAAIEPSALLFVHRCMRRLLVCAWAMW